MLAPETSEGWRPETIDAVKRTVKQDLTACTPEEAEAFGRYAIEEYEARLVRFGRLEHVVVVARKGNEVMYWEDVEEGFNISPIDSDGTVLERYCNQDTIAQAIRRWL